jgi:nucleoside-diphosphate-sugar epimerase
VNPLRRLAAALPARPRRMVLVSSTRVFDGDPGLRTLTEDNIPRPASPRAQALLDSESEARRLFDAFVIRPAGIYGPGREHLIRQVVRGTPMDR